MWVESGNMRSEMDTPASGDPMIAIVSLTDKEAYLYQPELKQATKMPANQSDVDTTSPKDYLDDVDPATMLFVKREIFDGKNCLV